MSKARNIADLLDASGDVAVSALDNVPPNTALVDSSDNTVLDTSSGTAVFSSGATIDGITINSTEYPKGRIVGFQNILVGGSDVVFTGAQAEFSLATATYTPASTNSKLWIIADIPTKYGTSINHSMWIRMSLNTIQDGGTHVGAEDSTIGMREGYSGGPWTMFGYGDLTVNRTHTNVTGSPITIDFRVQHYHGGTNDGYVTYFHGSSTGNVFIIEIEQL